MIFKRLLANCLQGFLPLRWGLRLGIIIFVPKTHIGAVGAIFNGAGEVLLVEHVFRPHYAWGLPGGWVQRGEHPAEAVQREIDEELNLRIQVKKLLLCEPQGDEKGTSTPLSLAVAYYCRLEEDDDAGLDYFEQAKHAYEILSVKWVRPEQIEWDLLPLHEKAIVLGKQEFEREEFAL